MKKHIGVIVFGIFVSFLIGQTVFAGSIKKRIDVVYNSIKIVVDGNTIALGNDAQGNKIEPFIYNGVTYLPVRTVGEALNKEVSWDGKNNTVYIGKTLQGADLTSLNYARSSDGDRLHINSWDLDEYSGPFRLAGRQYTNGIGLYMANLTEADVVYNINSLYKRLTGLFGTDDLDKEEGDTRSQMVIYGDGKELYRSPEMKPGSEPAAVDVDITGVKQLRLYFIAETGHYPVLANPKLN